MRVITLFLLSFELAIAGAAFAQTGPAAPTPAQTASAPRRAPAPASRSGIALTVTDNRGLPISGVRVTLDGASDRRGDTDDRGQVNFVGMQPGTYRLRFDGDKVISFEREITVRPGQPTSADVTLNPAPPPPAAPAAPPPPKEEKAEAIVGPPGMPQILSIVDLAEKQLSGNQPRRETLVSCSGNTRTTLVLLNQDQTDRLYDGAETEYYVVAGQGAMRLNGRETPLSAGSYAAIPRNTSHGIVKRGNRPLILLAVLSGEPCEQAK
ncbi:MAG TPA: carboxypeptidase regulatory-like domain-containing protein [Vicinamibacterales bacterium]|jgi:mannose-6-phosphate isomerase-like protein (cupin superfamily)|nr:carboxypeptidase regulatory-like domain-containing protein [Vicinamibacterales bacterium]